MSCAIPTPSEQALFNAAFLGFKLVVGEGGGLFIRCCAACPGKPLVERWAHGGSTRNEVSHGLCPKHYQEQIASITGDKT